MGNSSFNSYLCSFRYQKPLLFQFLLNWILVVQQNEVLNLLNKQYVLCLSMPRYQNDLHLCNPKTTANASLPEILTIVIFEEDFIELKNRAKTISLTRSFETRVNKFWHFEEDLYSTSLDFIIGYWKELWSHQLSIAILRMILVKVLVKVSRMDKSKNIRFCHN